MLTTKLNDEKYSHINNIGNGIQDIDEMKMESREKDKQLLLRQSSWFVSIREYEKLNTEKFKVVQLKELCTYYKLKKTGIKYELINRLYQYLKKTNNVIKIQSCIRRHLRNIYVSSAGPGITKRNLCKNDTDFYSLENITNIHDSQFYSIIDDKGNIFGFDIMSIYQLIHSYRGMNKPILNPYTRDIIHPADVIMVNVRIRLSGVLKIPITLQPIEDVMDENKKTEMDCIAIFQIINDLGNYADSDWFEALDRNQLLIFLRELYDIWNYRAQISEQTKREIVHPSGNPFDTITTSQNVDIIKKNAMKSINNLVTKGINREHCSLGALYVLSALTIVSIPAQIAIPWLYHSVM